MSTARTGGRGWRRRPAAVAVAVCAVLALGATGCSPASSTGSTSSGGSAASGRQTGAGNGNSANTAGFVGGDGTVAVVAPDKRKSAPVLTGTTLTGKKLTVGGTADAHRVVVLNVWGSWCAPCRKEADDLQQAYERLRKKPPPGVAGVDFVGINTRDEDPSPARAFVRSHHVTYPSLYDPDGKLLLGFAGTLPPTAIPSTLIIDPQGRVAARVIGATTTTTLVELVDQVVGA